ncbi:CidA/LrgA family protein [Xenorhabdus griffiniae]|uniref:CidA/LrgA family protein n=1 Tax=Xenorhabdus griffiniae TaxID=351672 RepID=UPI002358441A|nr:CidA/LrgA family protein [Xenorhabdus griffiniae]MDC9604651.1 CidA/LrgA family protein [Xenorhabdus griffiniae]
MSFQNVLIIGWQYLRAFALLYLCLIAGNIISAQLPFSLPGSIIGLLLLFGLLASQIIPSHWVKPGCSLLMKNMTLLFLPIGVGIMDYYPQLSQQMLPILLSCIVSTVIVMVVVAYSSHYIHRERIIIGTHNPTNTKQQELTSPPTNPSQQLSQEPEEKEKC